MLFQFEIIINVLASSVRFVWIPMLWVYDHYKYFRARIEFRHQNLTSAQEMVKRCLIWASMQNLKGIVPRVECLSDNLAANRVLKRHLLWVFNQQEHLTINSYIWNTHQCAAFTLYYIHANNRILIHCVLTVNTNYSVLRKNAWWHNILMSMASDIMSWWQWLVT